MRHDLKPFIFANQNSGYTVERAVLGKDAKYKDVASWRYSELPNIFSREKKADTYVVHGSRTSAGAGRPARAVQTLGATTLWRMMPMPMLGSRCRHWHNLVSLGNRQALQRHSHRSVGTALERE